MMPRAHLPTPRGRAECGFSYLGLLILIAVMGVALGLTGDLWQTASQREKEAQLLFVGDQFRQAIRHYVQQGAGRVRAYPMRLDDLLLDARYPDPHRYLRKIWIDPMTGTTDWGLVQGPNGEIYGVYSRSGDKPIKQANFDVDDAAFEGREKYSDWQFVYLARNAGGQVPGSGQTQAPTGPNRATPYQAKPPYRPFASPIH
jgi:type II secretory pathway pseudopilin PulG